MEGFRPALASEIAAKAALLFTGKPHETDRGSVRTDCYVVYAYTAKSQLAVLVSFSRGETDKVLVTVHDLVTLRHATYVYSYKAVAEGKFDILLNA